MAQLVDNLIAFRILSMLVTPFEQTKAYELGVIDKNGNALKKLKDMTWTEKDNYSMLHRMVFRLQKIMNKIPLVNSKLGTLATAYFLVKECYAVQKVPTNLEEEFVDLLRKIQKEDIVLVEEYLLVEEFLKLDEEMPANVTGVGVKTDEPVVRKKFNKLKVPPTVYKRFAKGTKTATRIGGMAEDQYDRAIYTYVQQNPSGVVILENTDTGEQKVMRFTKERSLWDKVTGN